MDYRDDASQVQEALPADDAFDAVSDAHLPISLWNVRVQLVGGSERGMPLPDPY